MVLLSREISPAPSLSRVTRSLRALRVFRKVSYSRRRRSLPSRQSEVRWIPNKGPPVFRVVLLSRGGAVRLRQIAYKKKKLTNCAKIKIFRLSGDFAVGSLAGFASGVAVRHSPGDETGRIDVGTATSQYIYIHIYIDFLFTGIYTQMAQ